MEMVREIIAEDIPRVKELLNKLFGKSDYSDIVRLGGMTNHSYRVTLDGIDYLVRIPGDGTEELIIRSDERKSTELACRLNIDSKLYHFGDDGTKVMEFISSTEPMTADLLKRSDVLTQAAEIFDKLHHCGEDTDVKFDVFEMAENYENYIKSHDVPLYDDYDEVKNTVMQIKSRIDSFGKSPLVPCHCDSLVDNWVLDKDNRLYLIDWEYSGMNDGMWDLADLSIEADFSEKDDEALLLAYFKREATKEEKQRFIANKLYLDYLWTLWGLTRVPFEKEFMTQYALDRYVRLKKNIIVFERV